MRGEDLRAIRKELGWTLDIMGAELGLTAQFVGMMERGVKPIERRTTLAVQQLYNQTVPLYDRGERPSYDGDVPLERAVIVWEPDEEALPAVKVVDTAGQDDPRYNASYGACNSDWQHSDDVGRLLRLFSRFQELTALHGLSPAEVHAAFWIIPEYRHSTAVDFVALVRRHYT